MAGTQRYRWLTLVMVLIAGVLGFSLLLNSGGPREQTAPETSDTSSDVSGDTSATAAPEQEALVTRMLADLRAGRKPESQDQPLAGAPVSVVRAGPDNPAPVGRLSISAIGLRTPFFEGVYEDAIKDGPGHWPGTPAIGDLGNSVISGHRSTETRPFLYLDRLTKGDIITFTRGGQQFSYAVDFVTIIPERGYVRYVTKQPAKPRARTVTLFACNPLTAHYQRIVVRGHAVKTGRAT